MMYVLKIEASANIESLGGVSDTVFSVKVSEEQFKDVLGKSLFSVERIGYPFTTADLYDEVVKGFESCTIRRQFQKIYSSDTLTVSIKIA